MYRKSKYQKVEYLEMFTCLFATIIISFQSEGIRAASNQPPQINKSETKLLERTFIKENIFQFIWVMYSNFWQIQGFSTKISCQPTHYFGTDCIANTHLIFIPNIGSLVINVPWSRRSNSKQTRFRVMSASMMVSYVLQNVHIQLIFKATKFN